MTSAHFQPQNGVLEMKNCEIDWDFAPEWAISHALFAFGSEISEVWVGEDKWQRLTQDKSFPYGGGGGYRKQVKP